MDATSAGSTRRMFLNCMMEAGKLELVVFLVCEAVDVFELDNERGLLGMSSW
jgi:hypothetical protein